jgi:DnaJ like chaperone protein
MGSAIVIFKLLFAFLGFRLAAWLGENQLAGLGIGLLVGHCLDYTATIKFYHWRARRAYETAAKAQFEEQFINSLFRMLGHICAADGRITPSEIAACDHLIKEVFKFGRKQRKMAIEAFQSIRKNPVPFQTSAMQIFELYARHQETLERAVHMLFNVAAADSQVNPNEEKLIRTAATIFGIDDARYHAISRPYFRPLNGSSSAQAGKSAEELLEQTPRASLEECYALLGCSKESSVDDIKRNYRKLATAYHPDKIVSKELPEDFIHFATQKFKHIQHAYECIKSERGIR